MNTDDALKTAVMQVAQAKVAEALGGDVLGKMITSVMDHKDYSSYSRDNDKTMFEKLVEGEVERCITSAVREHLAERGDELKSAVKTALTDHLDKVATQVVDGFANDDWRASLNLTVVRQKDDD